MEYIIMIVAHIIKSAEYFAAYGLPEIPLEQLPETVEVLIYNLVKITEIYLSGFV